MSLFQLNRHHSETCGADGKDCDSLENFRQAVAASTVLQEKVRWRFEAMLNSSQWVKITDTFSLKKMYLSYSRIPRMKLLAVVVKSRKPTPSTTWTPIRLSASTSRLTHSAKGRRCGLSQWWLAEAALRWSWMKSKHPVSPILKDQRGVAYHSVG